MLDSRLCLASFKPAGGVEPNHDPILVLASGALKQIALVVRPASRRCFRMPLARRPLVSVAAAEGKFLLSLKSSLRRLHLPRAMVDLCVRRPVAHFHLPPVVTASFIVICPVPQPLSCFR
ncbi:hypothetical protein TRVL_01392 [Trypanosoma vivax]|nr:hypothetical protein TRVL_01392 [Trypanosoma vivax]